MAYVSELQQDFERKLTEDKNRRANLEAQRETLRKEHLEARSQLDDDIDVEIQNLRGKYDAKLADEREASLRYKGENGIMKKKFTVINQQLEEHAERSSQGRDGRGPESDDARIGEGDCRGEGGD